MWRRLSEHLQVNQGEGIGSAETSWPINSPWIEKAAAEPPEEERQETQGATLIKERQKTA